MKKQNFTNLFNNVLRRGSGVNRYLFRYAAMVVVLCVLGVGEMWADSYYSQFTAKSGNSAQGLVYAAGDNSEGGMSDYTNQVTPDSDDGDSGAEYTWYAWAKAARGYKFKTWTKGSNINSSGSLTSAATTFGVKHATSDGSTVSGDATATFEAATAYTITFKKPENYGGYTAEYANYTISSNKFVDYSKTITMTSSSANTNETSYASDKITLKATARVANFIGWYNGSTLLSTKADGYTFSPSATMTVEGRWEEVVTHLDMTFKAVELDDSDNPKGSYTVGGTTVSTSDVIVNTGDLYYLETTLTASPADGYVFTGWYTKDGKKKNFISYDNPFNAYFDQATTVYASFTYSNYSNDQKAQFKVGSTYYTDLNAANTAAAGGSNKTIICTRDGVLPPGNYTISSGVSLLIPYSTSTTVQTTPTVVAYNSEGWTKALSAYRTLTFVEGANITCNGVICVAGQLVSYNGGKPSAYPIGACGLIDMSKGGHIELNNKSKLYCWGFIKGQDMDQGNNTLEVGTITANSGATVWEDFAVGDWRGGTACLSIYNNRNSWKFFPFQSYSIQNIEVPTTYKYGATLSNYTNVYGDGHTNEGTFSTIGSKETLFLLKDAQSVVKKWYNPATDLVCYQLSGTAQLDALNVDAGITTVSSNEYNLPISNNMHIILDDCNMALSKPMIVQAGAVIEVRENASLTCSSNVYLFDQDDWGLYCNGRYFMSFSNLTIHKNRGSDTSKDLLGDAKLIVDGELKITGKLYSTTGGAAVLGNGGGTVSLSTLPSNTNIVMCTGVSTNENVPVKSANFYNEDESYTQSNASKTFLNINGRWFNQTDGAATEKANHTYDFTYISSGAVSGSGGTNTTTDAVYSWDKTGLELRQKWFNVSADCNEGGHYWWHGQGDQTGWFYNWTLNSDWHQFMPTATAGLYSGSNNTLYTKTSCTWEELGSTDVNCLYEIGGVKKALVDGQFVALEANNNDPAYHEAEDPTKYYICFEGCNWHAADKYTEAEKAYIIEPDTFIWYDNAWMQVNFQEPFAYTIDETNVPVYYEYVDGEWVLAEPYVRVVDGLEDRPYWFFEDAFKFANSVLRSKPTITILRDLSTTSAAWSYTAANKEVTLDLSGKKLTLTVTGAGTSAIKMFDINASGTKFTITDSSDSAKGELRLIAAPNTAKQSKRWHGVYLTNGAALVLNAGKIYAEDNFKYTSTSDAGIVSAVSIAAGKSFTMNGGTIEAYSKYSAMGVYIAGSASANATVKIKGGTIHAETTEVTTAYGMYIAGGTTTITGGKIEARTKTTTAIGVATSADASGYYGTLKMEGGEIDALSTTTTAYGIQVGEAVVYSSGNTISNRVKSKATISKGTIRATSTTTKSSSHTVGVRSFGTTEITGGTIECNATQSIAYGVYAVNGTTTIKGTPTIIARAPTNAYGACAGLTPADKTGVPYNGHLEINGGHFDVSATTSTYAYGVLVQALGRAVNYSTKSGYYPGNYVSAGSATISGGEFDVQAHTTNAYGIFVKGAVTQTGAKLDADGNLADPVTSAPPTCTVSGGKFKVSGTGTVLATNNAADAANYHINGGYYNNNGNLANYTAEPKHVVTLSADDENRPDYAYKVGDAYLVTFLNKDGAGDPLQSSYQENGKAAVYEGETPTLASTTTESYIFDGWATEPNGAKVYEKDAELPNVTSAGATYYAYYETTALKYIVSLDASTNGGSCGTDKIYVEPGAAVGTLPTATRTGYTFDGWFTAASGGTKLTASTAITADATYYAQFTVKKYTLTWVLGDGAKVTTKGTAAAKNATGSPSAAVAYGTAITAPVVARTGYTFSRWEPLVAATMPAEAATYTAHWNPATNTAYSVKHYLQNVDGFYPTDPFETEAFTGTTATSVTPAVKSYEGFISPAAQTVTIAADGSTVVTYQYARRHYIFTLDAATNGGTSDVPSIEVIHGATIGAVPPDAQKGCNDFTGWYTKAEGGVKITSSFVIEYDMKKLYAQFSDDVRTYPITYLPGEHGTGSETAAVKTCGMNTTLLGSTYTRTGYTQTGWSTTDDGAKTHELGGSYTANAALTLYPFWTINNYQIKFVDEDGTTNLGAYPQTLDYDSPVTAPEEPTKAADENYVYSFAGWSDGVNTYASSDIPNVSGAVTYTATYSASPTVASVSFNGGAATYYTTFADAIAKAKTADKALITILSDISGISTAVTYNPSSTYSCTLDLNGHTVAGSVTGLLTINKAGATMTIVDNSSANPIGQLRLVSSGNANRYCVYVQKGNLILNSGTIYAQNTTAYSSSNTSVGASAVYVGNASTYTFTMNNGNLEAKAKYRAHGFYSYGKTEIKGGTIIATVIPTADGGKSNAYGAYSAANTTTISGNPTFTINAPTAAYGAFAAGNTPDKKTGAATNGTVDVQGGTFDITATDGAAYGVHANAGKRAISSTASGYTPGNYTSFGTVKVSGGEFNISGTTTVYGINVVKTSLSALTVGETTYPAVTKYGNATITGGKFNMTSSGGTAYAMNSAATATYLKVQGGYYSTKRTDASETSNIEDKYTAPTKSCNYWVLDKDDATYKYEVAEAYKVTWDATTNGGSCATAYTIVKKSAAIGSLPEASKTGSDFNGWFTAASEGTQVTAATTITAAKTYYAQFAPQAYSITYKDQGDVAFSGVHGDGYPTTHTYGTATALVSPTKTGYMFEGWYDNADCTGTALTEVGATAYAEDVVLYAKWTIVTYNLTYEGLNGATNSNPATYTVETPTITLADPGTRTGYDFTGWTSGGDPITQIPLGSTGDKTITANWSAVSYNLTYEGLNGATNSNPATYTIESATFSLADPGTRSGYTFTGWTCGGDPITQIILGSTGDKTITANWSVVTYNLTYEGLNGASNSNPATYTVETETFALADPGTRTGYTFTGWTCGGDPIIQITLGSTGDKTITANWEQSGVTITWKSEDGTSTLETDNLVLIGAAPSFDGTAPTKATTESYTYTFDGWTTEANGAGTFYAIGELPTVSSAATYYAHFTATANVASVKVGSTTTYYTTIDAAFAHVNLQTANTELKLLQNATAAASLVFTPAAAITCTFDLNNCTLSGELGRLIDVKLAKSTFIITDNSVAKGGKVDNNYNANERVYGVVLTAGTFKLLNGAIYSTNPHTYSSATANKSSAATAVYVASGQTFTMENGMVESASQYASYAIYMARGTSTVTIKNGLVKGRTTKSTTAAGIYNLGKGLTVNGGHIVAHAYTTTAYGIYLYGGHGTINGGTIEATNDTTDKKGSTTTYGIYVNYYNSTYKGVLTIPSTSTVEVFAKARTNTSYAIVVGGGSTGNTIAGGTFTAKTKTGKTAYCVNSSGNITISGGTFTANAATTNAYGIYSARGTITVNGNPTFNVTAGSTTAYGALAYGTIGKKGTGKDSGTIEINGGTFNVTSTKETAYGAYAGLASRDLRSCSATNDTVPGLHYMPGILVVNDGTFNVKATTTGAFGIVVAKAKSESGTVGTTARIPKGTIKGGKFKVESMGDANATAYAMNSATTEARLVVQGGYYNTKRTDASETSNIEDKYTAPTLSNNYRVLDLPEEELPYKYKVAETYNLKWDAAGGELSGSYTSGYTAVGDPIIAPTATRTDYDFNGWDESPADKMPASNKTYTATWTLAETGDYLDIVDWTTSTLTINANGWTASGWPYTINNVVYYKDQATATANSSSNYRAADRTLTIPYEGAAGTNLQIKVESGGSTTSLHNYKIPYINTTEGAGEEDIVYVNSGTLTIDGDKNLAALYIRPEASVEVTNGTSLTVGKLVLRTLPWQAAAISGNFTATETWYTRIAPNKRTISGPDADLTYESASYYQFALPLNCTVPLSEIYVSHGANTPYGNTWLLKYYDEANRAANGPGGSNWVALEEDDYIQGGVGYEMSSNSNYYREFYFPVGAVNSASLGTTTTVSYHESPKGANHAGWNIICSPLMGTYENKFEDIETALKISELQTDGSYLQYAPEEIPAAIPFSYQAGKNGVLDFSGTELTEALSAPRRRMPATEEFVRLQWLRLFVKDDDGHGDETSILSHPTRYEEAYKTGIDVAKQSFTASRALIYSSHAYGEMAFAGVADSLLEKGVALTIYSPSAQSLTISMRENNWLNRMEYVWLIDKETGIRTDLLTDEYSFYATEGTTAGRFFIEGVFAPKVTTDLQNDGMMNDESRMARKLLIDDKIYIDVNGRRYDATGKLVNDK